MDKDQEKLKNIIVGVDTFGPFFCSPVSCKSRQIQPIRTMYGTYLGLFPLQLEVKR